MMAIGKGFVNPSPEPGSALDAFLNHKVASISPEEALAYGNLEPPLGVHRAHRYLYTSIGLMWRLFGISARTLAVFQSIVLAVTALILFGLFSLGMGPLLSAACTVFFLSTPAFLSYVPYDRDFSKAPFILACILLLGKLIREPSSSRRFFAIAALAGVVAGVGLGFRQDMNLCLPAILIVLSFCPRHPTKHILRQRLVGMLLTLGVWFICAWPILSAVAGGEAQTCHSLVAGFGCDSVLGVEGGSCALFRCCDDIEASEAYSSYDARMNGGRDAWDFFSPAAEARARRFLVSVLQTFPGDCVTRAYAASLYVLGAHWSNWEEPFSGTSFLGSLASLQEQVARHWREWRFVYMTLTFFVIAVYSWRTALLSLFILLYFTGSTALQFQSKHVFHLGFFCMWFMGFVLQGLLRLVQEGRKSLRLSARLKLPVRTGRLAAGGLCVAGAYGMLFFILYATRMYQCHVVEQLLPAYVHAELEAVQWEPLPVSGGGVVHIHPCQAPDRPLAWPDTPSGFWRLCGTVIVDGLHVMFDARESAPRLQTEYWAVECDVNREGMRMIPVYERSGPCFEAPVTVRAFGGRISERVVFFVPVYEISSTAHCSDTRFQGFNISEADVSRIKGVYRVKDLKGFTLLPYLALPKEASPSYFTNTLPPFHLLPRHFMES